MYPMGKIGKPGAAGLPLPIPPKIKKPLIFTVLTAIRKMVGQCRLCRGVFTFTTFVVGVMDPLLGENAVVSVVLSCFELLVVFTFGDFCSYCYHPG